MKRVPVSVLVLVSLTFFISCASMRPPDLSKKEKELMHTPPTPYAKVTAYSQALTQLGNMLAVYGQPQGLLATFGKSKDKEFVIQGRHVVNKTTCKTLPADITDMIKTAFGKVGGGVRYTQYDPTYLSNEYATGSVKISRKLPVVVLDGAITECDEDIDVGATGIDADADFDAGSVPIDIGAGTSNELGYSRLAIDLHLMNYANSLLLPKKQTAIAIQVAALEKRKDFRFFIDGSGLGIDRVRKLVHGKSDAVRILAELSVLQLLGRLFEVPYWRLIPGAEQDPQLVNLIKQNYGKASEQAQIFGVQYFLKRHGFQLEADGKINPSTQAAINQYVTQNGSGLPRSIGPELYAHLYFTMPLTNIPQAQIAQPQVPPVPAAGSQSVRPDSNPLALHNAIVFSTRANRLPRRLHHGNRLHSGDLYQFMLMPEENCFLYIFQLDSTGQLYQLFPMESFDGVQLNNRNPVRGKTAITLPGPDMNFVLDRQQGTERIYLLASRQPDSFLENMGRLLTQSQDSMTRQNISRKLSEYIKSKNVVQAVAPGMTFYTDGQGGSGRIGIDADRLDMSGNQVYVFEFEHQ